MSEKEPALSSEASQLEALNHLMAKVTSGEEPTADEIWEALRDRDDVNLCVIHIIQAFHVSMDAAMALFEDMLQGWRATHVWGPGDNNTWTVNLTKHGDDKPLYAVGKSEIFSRAWLIANLRALIKERETE